MHLAGISTTVLLQAAAALGLLVVVFYVLKLKRRPIAVPFAPLWQRILKDKDATTLFSQLKRLLSLLLQLLLLGLMLLALGDPRPAANIAQDRHVLVLIDASASMKAVDVAQPAKATDANGEDDKPRTRLDVGKDRIREAIRGLGGSDRMLVAQLDAAVTPLSTMTEDVPALEKALDAVTATDVRTDFARGLRFAVDALRDLPNAELVIVSDGALGAAKDAAGQVELDNIKLSYVPVGKGGRNVALTGFSVRRYPLDKSRYEVLVEVANTDDAPAEVDLELYGDGQLTDIVRLRLEPLQTLSRFYPNLSGADKTLRAQVKLLGDEPDVLPADDNAYALLPERRRAQVQVVSEGNMYLEAALLLDEYLEVVTVVPKDYPGAGKYDVTIFDGVAPVVADGSGHLFYLNPPPKAQTPFKVGDEVKSDKRYTLGFDEVDIKHALVRHLSLGDVNIGKGRMLEGVKRDKHVGKSFKGTLLLAGRRKGTKFVALGFDLRESDLPLRIAWPMLLLNSINDFIEEDADYLSSFRTGTVWRIPASSTSQSAWLKSPSGRTQRVPIKDGRAVYLGQHAGFYTLLAENPAEAAGAVEQSMFAANLIDPLESSIQPQPTLAVGEQEASPLSGFEVGVRQEIWVYLLLLVLGITAIEWLSYHRRVTV